MSVRLKICGLSEPEAIETAIRGGAHFLGFVFYPPSPRFVSFDLAGSLAAGIPAEIEKVGVFVDPDDDTIRQAIAAGMDVLQLHGSESPERVQDIRSHFNKPVIKALRIANLADLAASEHYENMTDFLMFDTKSSKPHNSLPGGTGEAFDWTILQGKSFAKPWFLSGGLTVENLSDAIDVTGAALIDVSSGVEDQPGRKSLEKIRTLLGAITEMNRTDNP